MGAVLFVVLLPVVALCSPLLNAYSTYILKPCLNGILYIYAWSIQKLLKGVPGF